MGLRLETMIAINYLEEHKISGIVTNVTENWFEYSHKGKRYYVSFAEIL